MKTVQQYVSFIIRWLSEENKRRCVLCMLGGLLLQGLSVLFPITQRNMLNSLGDQQALLRAIPVLAFCGLSIGVIQLMIARLRTKLNIGVQHDLQLKLIVNGIEESNSTIEMRGAGAYISTVYGDCEQLAGILSAQVVWAILLSAAQIVIVAVITLSWTYSFLVILVAAYAVVAVCIWIGNRISKPEFRKFREILMQINPKILESLENRLTTLGYANFSAARGGIDELFSRRDSHVLKSEMAVQVSSALVSWCALASQVALIIVSAYQMSAGKIELGDLVALISYMSISFTPVMTIKSSWEQLGRFSVLETRVHDNLHRQQKEVLTACPPYTFQRCTVTYQKDREERTVFKEFDRTLSGVTGLVGLSGAGKTSLIQTMLGKIVPKEGQCCIGEEPVTAYSFHTLLGFVRYYPQVPEVFDDTVEYNLTLGKHPLSREEFYGLVQKKQDEIKASVRTKRTRALVDEIKGKFGIEDRRAVEAGLERVANDLRACLEYAVVLLNCDYYIREKYEELLRVLDLAKLEGRKLGMRGSAISGGEKHKIALARFLLPEGGGFFILDEPFSNIDILTLKSCVAVFQKYRPCRDGIIVSHDLHVIRGLSDSILLIEEGETPVTGRHEELLARSALYRRLSEEFDAFHNT